MYWHASNGTYRQSAHDSIGITQAQTTWFLAEGSTGGDEGGSFETWVLVANPSSEKATVDLTYLTPDGEVPGPRLELNPGTRTTVNVADTVAGRWSVSTRVTSDSPVVAERAMYWSAK